MHCCCVVVCVVEDCAAGVAVGGGEGEAWCPGVCIHVARGWRLVFGSHFWGRGGLLRVFAD